MLICSRSWAWPIAKSLGSCAGVTLTKPVPKPASTCQSEKMGISRFTMGSMTLAPTSLAFSGSLGETATPVSPSMVSGRVVATVTYSTPSTGSTSG